MQDIYLGKFELRKYQWHRHAYYIITAAFLGPIVPFCNQMARCLGWGNAFKWFHAMQFSKHIGHFHKRTDLALILLFLTCPLMVYLNYLQVWGFSWKVIPLVQLT